ncbi:hypothetical protein D9J09_22985 [Escherichia coli]|nr:hypothetical protein [Escherichia coli]
MQYAKCDAPVCRSVELHEKVIGAFIEKYMFY